MARYYFDIHNHDVTIDHEGIVCSDTASARARAIDEARNLAAEEIREQGCLVLHYYIAVRDEAGTRIETVTFKDAIKIRD